MNGAGERYSVVLIPLGLLMLDLFLLWAGHPAGSTRGLNRALMLVDLSGSRWLAETWLKVDRGVSFYNVSPIPYDAAFLISRLVFILLGRARLVFARFIWLARSGAVLRECLGGRRPSSRTRSPSPTAVRSQPVPRSPSDTRWRAWE